MFFAVVSFVGSRFSVSLSVSLSLSSASSFISRLLSCVFFLKLKRKEAPNEREKTKRLLSCVTFRVSNYLLFLSTISFSLYTFCVPNSVKVCFRRCGAFAKTRHKSFVKGRRPAQRETTTTTTILMASRPEPGSFWGGRRGRRFVLAALVDEEGKEKDRAPNGRHDKTSQEKNRMLLADFDVRRRRTPRGGGGALFFVAAVFFGAVLFFFGGEGTIEESEVRGGRRTHQRRGLLAESAARGEKNIFSLLYWRAKCPQHPPPGLCASPFCFFARARDA